MIVPTYADSELTTACVESLLADGAAGGGPVEVVVWDNGSAPEVAAELDRLAGERVQVHHSPENHGFALGNNLGLAHATGDVVVFLNNDTTVPPGWLVPLREALADDDVLGAQPLLLYPGGTVQSAGVAFPTCGGLPHAFLQGFPVEDAAWHRGAEVPRAHRRGARAAVRRRGRAARLRPGVQQRHGGRRPLPPAGPAAGRSLPGPSTPAPVVHHESRTPGRYDKHLVNRRSTSTAGST